MISILSFKGDTLRVRVTLESKNLPGVKVQVDFNTDVELEDLRPWKGGLFYTFANGCNMEEARLIYPGLGDHVISLTDGLLNEAERAFESWLTEEDVSTLDAVRQA